MLRLYPRIKRCKDLFSPGRLYFSSRESSDLLSSLEFRDLHPASVLEREEDIKELKRCNEKSTHCRSKIIKSFVAHFHYRSSRTPEADILILLQTLGRDVVDLLPRDQTIITQIAWEVIVKLHYESVSQALYNTALDTFLFQNVPLNEEDFLSDMKVNRVRPNNETSLALMSIHARDKNIEKMHSRLELLSSLNFKFDHRYASRLIRCYANRGEFDEADKIVLHMKENEIFFHESEVGSAYTLGAATAGDLDMLSKCIETYEPNEETLQEALLELSKVAPNEIGIVTKELPFSRFRKTNRRVIKQLVQDGEMEAAEMLIKLSAPYQQLRHLENEVETFFSLPGILVSELTKTETVPDLVVSKVDQLEYLDVSLPARTVVMLADLYLADTSKEVFCKQALRLLEYDMANPNLRKKLNVLLTPCVRDRLKDCVTENDALLLIKKTSDLGIRLEDDMMRSVLFQFVTSRDQEYTVDSLYKRVFEVRELLDNVSKRKGGVYSTSVIWSHLFRFLLSVRNEIFFQTAANVAIGLGVVYGAQRWSDMLGYSLYHTRDALSFVKILEVALKNCKKRGDGEEMKQVGFAINVAILLSRRTNTNIEVLLGNVADMIVERNLAVHEATKRRMLEEVKDGSSEASVKKVKVIETNDFKSRTPRSVFIPDRKNNRRKDRLQISELTPKP